MSHNLVFYKVSRVAEELPDIINTDNTELPYYDVRTEHAADWGKEIGTVRTIEYSIVDQYAASEKLFGKRPQSIGTFPEYYLNPDSIWAQLELVFPDGEKKFVHRSEVEKFRTNRQYQAYIYCRDEIVRVDSGYKVESEAYEGKPLSEQEILKMARQYLKDYGDCYGGFAYEPDPMVIIMKAYFAVVDGDCIICNSQ